MRKDKYSPGPWIITDGWDKEGNGKYFPSIHFQSTDGLRDYVVVNTSHNHEKESIMANAYLIAAAPDLLESLENLVEAVLERHLQNDGIIMVPFTRAQMIIKKARGEE